MNDEHQRPDSAGATRPDIEALRDVIPGASPGEPGGASNFFESPAAPQADPNLTPEQKRAFSDALDGPDARGEGSDPPSR